MVIGHFFQTNLCRHLQEMTARVEEIVNLTSKISADSNMTAEVLREASILIENASRVLTSAQQLQVCKNESSFFKN